MGCQRPYQPGSHCRQKGPGVVPGQQTRPFPHPAGRRIAEHGRAKPATAQQPGERIGAGSAAGRLPARQRQIGGDPQQRPRQHRADCPPPPAASRRQQAPDKQQPVLQMVEQGETGQEAERKPASFRQLMQRHRLRRRQQQSARQEKDRREQVVLHDRGMPPDAMRDGQRGGADRRQGSGGTQPAGKRVEERHRDRAIDRRDHIAAPGQRAERQQLADEPADQVVECVVAGEGAQHRTLHRLHDHG